MPTPKIDRKKMRLKMKKKFEEVQETQGEEYTSVGDFYLDLPEGTKRWFPEIGDDAKDDKGMHFFDIIPFVVGDKYPTGTKGGKKGRNIDINVEEGDLYHKLDIWYHKNIGPDNLMVPCAYRNHDKKCPICEWVNEEYNNIPEIEKDKRSKFWAENGSKRQTVFNVRIVDKDGNSLSDDIHVFNQPYPYMDKILKEKSVPAKGGKIYYADPDEGRTIFFRKTKDDDYGYDVTGHEFYERDYVISDEDMENAVQLDKYIKEYTYDEIKAMMDGDSVPSKSETKKTESKDKIVEGDIPDYCSECNEVVSKCTCNDEAEEEAEIEQEQEVDDEFAEFKNDDGVFVSCPSEANFGKDFDNYEECDTCPAKADCETANAPKKRRMKK